MHAVALAHARDRLASLAVVAGHYALALGDGDSAARWQAIARSIEALPPRAMLDRPWVARVTSGILDGTPVQGSA